MQRERMIQYAQDHHWQVVEQYEDAGFSGANPKRPALVRLLKDAEEEKFSVVLQYKVDRLGRDVPSYQVALAKLESWGVDVISITQEFDMRTSGGRFNRNIMVAAAGFERDQTIERTIDALASLRDKGELFSGVAPFGFKHENGTLHYVEDILPIAKDIFRRATTGVSQREIARSLGLSRDKVRSIVTNPLFAGYVAYRKRDENDSRVPFDKWLYKPFAGAEPIMDFENWKELQRELHMRSERSSGKTLPLFGKRLRCEDCDHLLSAHGNAKGGQTKYACQSSGSNQQACGTQVWEQYLLPAVLPRLSSELKGFTPKYDGEERIQQIDVRIAKTDKDIERLQGRLAIPDAPVGAIVDKIAQLRQERHDVLQERAAADEGRARLQEVQDVLKDFSGFYTRLDREGQHEAMQRFIKCIDLGKSHLVIHWQFSQNLCELPRSEASPKARKRDVRGRVVEIGGIDNIGVQLDASYELLLNLFPNLPADAERQPSKQRKTQRHRMATPQKRHHNAAAQQVVQQ
jgi:DNA invertase Pin-like site-specific DNA recombinase